MVWYGFFCSVFWRPTRNQTDTSAPHVQNNELCAPHVKKKTDTIFKKSRNLPLSNNNFQLNTVRPTWAPK